MRFSFRNFFTRSRLRNKFLLFFVVLACVPVLVLGGTTLYLLDVAHRRDVSNLEMQAIRQKEEQVNAFLADSLGVLELRVQQLDASILQHATGEWHSGILQGLLEANPNFQEVSFLNTEGKEVAKKSKRDEEPILLNVRELDKFKEARKGNSYIGEVYYTLDGPFVQMAAPVTLQGQVFEILTAQVNLFALIKSIENVSLGTTGYTVLLDRNGTFLSHQQRGSVRPGTPLKDWSRFARAIQGETLDGLDSLDRYESLFGAGPVVGAAKKISHAGWVILAEWPIADADAVIQQVRNQILAVTIASIIAVLLLAPLFAARLVRPIRMLQAAAQAVEKGDLNREVTLKTNDEVEELGAAFNNMVQGLKRLQELREEFVFVAAHELRTPVTIIKGYASMVLEGDAGKVNKTLKTYLEEIQGANQRLLRLVEDLLEVARSEAGRIKIEVAKLSVVVPIAMTMSELNQLAKKKRIQLEYEQPKEDLFVMADDHRVREIMDNLVGNSIKYTQAGGKIRVFHEVKDTELITHIEDNGFGIDTEAQKKIFQKFYRVQTQETKNIQGTGLGLFIVKELVEKMKGKIWFVSEKGRGTTFSFSLPMAAS